MRRSAISRDSLRRSGNTSASGVDRIIAGTGISINPVTGVGTVTVTNAGVTSLIAGTGITVSGATGAVTVSANLSAYFADWARANPRFYALDPDGGNDANAGYSDVSMAAAGAVAKATWAALLAIIPLHGAARQIVIAIKPRAAGATIAENFEFRNSTYRSVIIRGTTDFSDSATDRIRMGGVVSDAGPNGDQSFTVGVGSTISTVVIDAGQTLPGDTTITGRRIRFVSGALSGTVANVAGVVAAGAGGSFEVGADLSGAPVAGATFVIEKPGVAFQRVCISGDSGSENSTQEALNFTTGLSIGGIASTDDTLNGFSIMGPLRRVNAAFNDVRGTSSGLSILGIDHFDGTNSSFRTQTGGSVNVGVGFRIEGSSVFIQHCRFLRMSRTAHMATTGGGFQLYAIGGFAFGDQGSYFGSGVSLNYCGWGRPNSSVLGASGIAPTETIFGRDPFGASTTRSPRVTGKPSSSAAAGFYIRNSNVVTSGAVITGAGASPAVLAEGIGLDVRLDAVSGSTGNTDVGFDFSRCLGSTLLLGTQIANTVTGTAGDIRIPGSTGVFVTHATFAITNIVDNVGNNFQGSAGKVVSQCQLAVNRTTGTRTVGEIAKSNNVSTEFILAQADTNANAQGACVVWVTPTGEDELGYVVDIRQGPWVLCGAAPTVGNIVYLSAATAGQGTTTVPAVAATNQKLRLGWCVAASGNYAKPAGGSELLPILSDGVAP